MAVAVLLFGIQAHAGMMTQTSNFHFASHGGTGAIPPGFNQLDPSLAPLNAVLFTLIFSASFETFEVLNPTFNTISFNATLSGSFGEGNVGIYRTQFTEPVTLPGGQSTFLTPLTIPPPGVQLSNAQTTGLSEYVGTGQVFLTFGGFDNATIDNSLIQVSNLDASDFRGTETVTYYYGSTLLLPEPASLAMLSLGLAAVAIMRWQHRKSKLTA
jgi:hypothetical protein